jgi:hypothetical protein
MEDLFGEIVVAVVSVVAAAVWRKIESGRLKAVIRATIEGVEKGTATLPENEAKAVKQQIQAEAMRTGAQARLHALVEKITKERT